MTVLALFGVGYLALLLALGLIILSNKRGPLD